MRLWRKRGSWDSIPSDAISVQVHPVPPELRPSPRVEVTVDARDCTFDVPGPAVALERVLFERVEFDRPRVEELLVTESRLVECEFRSLVAHAGSLGTLPPHEARRDSEQGRSVYERCLFIKCDLSTLDPGWTRFDGCVFEECKITKWFAYDASFVGCRFPRTSLRESTFSAQTRRKDARGCPFANEVRDNDFREADLVWTSFVRGVDLDRQIWPDEDVLILTNFHERARVAQKVLARWKDRAKSDLAQRLLESYVLRVGPEQRDVFFHMAHLDDPVALGVEEELFEVLRNADVD